MNYDFGASGYMGAEYDGPNKLTIGPYYHGLAFQLPFNSNQENIAFGASCSERMNQEEERRVEETKVAFYPNIENKRVRNMFNAAQIDILERVFEQTHYPDSTMREQLARRLNLSVGRIQVWFQNRRAKYKKFDSMCPTQGKKSKQSFKN